MTRDHAEPPETEPPETKPQDSDRRPLIDVGWVLAGRLDEEDRMAVRRARREAEERLQDLFPDFRWRMSRMARRALTDEQRRRPEQLLDVAADERDVHRWDFTFVVTDADLLTYRKRFALGAPSRAISCAVLSTARLLTDVEDTEDVERDAEVKARRLVALLMHLLGHLAHLDNEGDPDDYMYEFGAAADLDNMQRYSDDDLQLLHQQLEEVADVRLEETGRFRGRVLAFYLRAAWDQRREIWSSIRRVQPWLFPLRLGRLTTAAASALVVLCVTAESWELGMTQPPERIAVLSGVTILALAGLLLRQQRLVLVQRGREPSEQRVVADVSIVVAMLLGLTLVYALLFGGTFVLSQLLFPRELLAGWTPSLDGGVGLDERLNFSGFVAFLGLIVGALGASFEDQAYFRHITLVDEET